MALLSLNGPPLHARLNDLPAALLPASLVLDVLALTTGGRSFADASRYALVGAAMGGAAAGATGFADYRSLPANGEAHRLGRVHGLLNAGLMGLTLANLLLRGDRARPGPMSLVLGVVGNLGLLISGSLGMDMVYGKGTHVTPSARSRGGTRRKAATDKATRQPISVGGEVGAA